MSGAQRRGTSGRSLAQLRHATVDRLRTRRAEIDEAVIHRTLSVAPPDGTEVPGYVEALRAAIPSAVEYAFAAIEIGEERLGPTPAAISVQATASARSEVGLDVVLRRYASGYSTMSDFLNQEVRALVGDSHPGYAVLQRELTALFDRLVVEVSEVYRREEAHGVPSPRERRLSRIRRLLAGDLVDPAGLEYPLDGSHIAVVASGGDPEEAAGELAAAFDRRLLVGETSHERCAFWLGGGSSLTSSTLKEAACQLPDRIRLAIGEPGEGLAGWRRTRRQAEAAELVGERGGAKIVRYCEVALLAAVIRDPDLSQFLTDAYIDPLCGERPALGETVLAFLELNGNSSSTAARLGVSRQTVASRLRVATDRLGSPPELCGAELQTALRLARLEQA